MFCGKCGAQLRGEPNFCVQCGAAASTQVRQESSAATQTSTKPAAGNPAAAVGAACDAGGASPGAASRDTQADSLPGSDSTAERQVSPQIADGEQRAAASVRAPALPRQVRGLIWAALGITAILVLLSSGLYFIAVPQHRNPPGGVEAVRTSVQAPKQEFPNSITGTNSRTVPKHSEPSAPLHKTRLRGGDAKAADASAQAGLKPEERPTPTQPSPQARSNPTRESPALQLPSQPTSFNTSDKSVSDTSTRLAPVTPDVPPKTDGSRQPEPGPLQIPSGTTVIVKTVDPVDSGVDHEGDLFRAMLAAPIVIGGRLSVPQGAEVYLRVLEVHPAGHTGRASEIRLVLSRLAYQGHSYSLSSTSYDLFGVPRGKRFEQAQISPGTEISFQLNQSITISYPDM
jgi:hypothetical protein